MCEERGLDLDCAEAVGCNIDDFIGAAGEPDVAVLVHVRRVAGEIDLLVRYAAPVVFAIAVVFSPEGRREAGERSRDDKDALFPSGAGLAFRCHDGGFDAGHGRSAGAGLDGEHRQAVWVADKGAAGLGLPVVVDDRNSVFERLVLQPVPRGRVQHLSCAEDALQRRQFCLGLALVAIAHEQTHCGGRGEHAGYSELVGYLPDGIGRRVVDCALEGDGSCARQKRRIDDVRVPDDPADVGG